MRETHEYEAEDARNPASAEAIDMATQQIEKFSTCDDGGVQCSDQGGKKEMTGCTCDSQRPSQRTELCRGNEISQDIKHPCTLITWLVSEIGAHALSGSSCSMGQAEAYAEWRGSTWRPNGFREDCPSIGNLTINGKR
ncbi:hypothetical protein CJF32_00010268 [Rutstroemia sp. NJR-2017a WRK4]|nr:hypothetical protein CJF32_00010268 [Rutstroemia sp. NJR-2017a WRK4]